jgi:hypothetical protein
MVALCCCSLNGTIPEILGAYQADLYLRVAVGRESGFEHGVAARIQRVCDVEVFRSQLEIFVQL